jgi:hypothetical protein
MVQTKHTMEEALEIQKDFEDKYAKTNGVVGVGICMNQKRDDLAINVYVSRQPVNLPGDFEGLDVVVDVVDGFKGL